jgi:hypothetical protein
LTQKKDKISEAIKRFAGDNLVKLDADGDSYNVILKEKRNIGWVHFVKQEKRLCCTTMIIPSRLAIPPESLNELVKWALKSSRKGEQDAIKAWCWLKRQFKHHEFLVHTQDDDGHMRIPFIIAHVLPDRFKHHPTMNQAMISEYHKRVRD